MRFGCTRYAGRARLDEKTAIITGCNSGIGKFTAQDLYQRGCRVIMACRDVGKAESAKQDIIKQWGESEGERRGELLIIPLDLSSLHSVRQFAAKVMAEEKQVNLLINNAGLLCGTSETTEDGFETHFGVNHLGHFLLTLLLLPRILASGPARIINLTSIIHNRAGRVDWEAVHDCTPPSPLQCYAISKMAILLFTKELAKRLEGTAVTVYAVHPGHTDSGIVRNLDDIIFMGVRWVYETTGRLWLKDAEQGAATTIHCAVDEKAGKETGLYYEDCQSKPCHPLAEDAESASKLWRVSATMTQLTDNFDPFVPQPKQ